MLSKSEVRNKQFSLTRFFSDILLTSGYFLPFLDGCQNSPISKHSRQVVTLWKMCNTLFTQMNTMKYRQIDCRQIMNNRWHERHWNRWLVVSHQHLVNIMQNVAACRNDGNKSVIKATDRTQQGKSSDVNIRTATPILRFFTLPVLAGVLMNHAAGRGILFLHKPFWRVTRTVSIYNNVYNNEYNPVNQSIGLFLCM